jgi:hypothetical protein
LSGHSVISIVKLGKYKYVLLPIKLLYWAIKITDGIKGGPAFAAPARKELLN